MAETAFSGQGARALLVEPDPGLRAQLSQALSAAGLGVTAVASGREALAAEERQRAQIFIIAGQLPEMSGFDLARSLRRQAGPSEAVLILLTEVAWSPAQKAAALQQMGLSELLLRPVQPAAVVEAALRGLQALYGAMPRTITDGDPSLADAASRLEKRVVEREAKQLQASAVELRGNLAATPFPRLLHTLYRRRATGALFMDRAHIKKIVYFREGHPSYVRSNLLSECLGKVLVREGLISEAQCRESLRLMKQSRRQQGTVLVELGIISPQNLVVGLELQLRAKLIDIFTWTRGEFRFSADARMPSEVIRLDLSTAALVVDGLRSSWELSRLEEALEPSWERYMVPSPDPELRFQELALTDEEQRLLESADGVRRLRQLLAETALPRQRALAVAYALLCTGVLEAREQPCSQEPPPRPAGRLRSPEEPLREQLAQQILSLRQRDAYGVLGVSATSSDEAIEQAYSSLAREYHPDRFRSSSLDTRQLADEIFSIIYQAYRKIATIERRQIYRERYSTQELREVSPTGGDTLVAERLKREALDLAERRAYAEALDRMDRAVNLRPGTADLWTLHAWLTYQSDPESPASAQKATRELRRAIELEPHHYQPYLYLGRIYSAMGKAILAEKQFEKALQCKPDCAEALQALRQQRARRPPRRPPRG